jgi:hypothetical protein
MSEIYYTNPPKKPAKKKIILIIIVSILVVVGIAFAVLAFMNKPAEESPNPTDNTPGQQVEEEIKLPEDFPASIPVYDAKINSVVTEEGLERWDVHLITSDSFSDITSAIFKDFEGDEFDIQFSAQAEGVFSQYVISHEYEITINATQEDSNVLIHYTVVNSDII